MHSVNGGAAVQLLDDVQQLRFSYLTRALAISPYTPPPLQPSQWGMRWAVAGRFGYDTLYASSQNWNYFTIATRASLDKMVTLKSITAYLDSPNGTYRYAVYSHNALLGGPLALVAQTGVGTGVGTGWHTLSVPPTVLTPGTYWLVMFYTSNRQKHYYLFLGGETYRSTYDSSGGFPALWSGSTSTYGYRLSIYGTYD
jgi:hypothetical protein